MTAVLLLSSAPSQENAAIIARQLLEEKLAACVQISSPILSLYHWQSKIEESHEVQLWIKTTESKIEAAIQKLKALHPYEIPEILAFKASSGLPDYLAWLLAETKS